MWCIEDSIYVGANANSNHFAQQSIFARACASLFKIVAKHVLLDLDTYTHIQTGRHTTCTVVAFYFADKHSGLRLYL